MKNILTVVFVGGTAALLLMALGIAIAWASVALAWWLWATLSPIYLNFIPALYIKIPFLHFLGLSIIAGTVLSPSLFPAFEKGESLIAQFLMGMVVGAGFVTVTWIVWIYLAPVYLTFLPVAFIKIPFFHFVGLVLLKNFFHRKLLVAITRSPSLADLKKKKTDDTATKQTQTLDGTIRRTA